MTNQDPNPSIFRESLRRLPVRSAALIKMTECSGLCSNQQIGLLHIPKRASGSCGNGTRIGAGAADNRLLQARHAVFGGGPGGRRRPVKYGLLRIFGILLSKRYNRAWQKLKKVSSRALFSVLRVVQSSQGIETGVVIAVHATLKDRNTEQMFDDALREQARNWA